MDTYKNTRREVLAGMGAAALGLLGWRAWHTQEAEPERVRRAGSQAGRLPNTRLITHEGREVRFYDDLVRGKVVAINMMYGQCAGICPMATSNLLRVQEMLGERVGRDVFMYSITLKPEEDIPRGLKLYAERYGVRPGWQFLTGTPADIRDLRYRLGFYDPDQRIDEIDESHTGMVRIGNDRFDRWTMAPALAEPDQILATINHVDNAVVHTRAVHV